jgi:hypothetical protein
MIKEKILLDSITDLKTINILKISIICFVGISMILFFDPYYERTEDSYFYGISAIKTINQEYIFVNELLQNDESQEFIPTQWVKTIHGNAIPVYYGMPSISSAIYGVFGLYGLFYFGPIATIVLLITSERITTKLFGNIIGLVALLFLATSELILYVGRVLLTDNFFTIFFILGIFFLIKFYKEKKENYILLASVFFVFSTFIRINGIISFPIELAIIGLMLFNQKRLKNKFSINNHENFRSQKIKTWGIFSGKIIIPWLVLLLFIFSYNLYFFGDGINKIDEFGAIESLLKIEHKDRLNNFLTYSNSILPSPLNRIDNFAENYDQRLDDYYPNISRILKSLLSNEMFSEFNFGIISLSILGIGILLAIKTKQNYFEIILYSVFIFGFLFVFSKNFVTDRYMIPILPLFFTIISYLLLKPFYYKNSKNLKLLFISKISAIIFISIFFSFAFYLSEPIQILKIDGFDITDPNEKAKRYPLDKEGLSEKSIVLGILSSKTLDYELIPFNPIYNHPKKIEFDQNYVIPETIDLIKSTMKDGYDFYSFKDPQSHLDKPFLKYLVENYDFVVKDYSPNFCKVEIGNENSEKSDENCF